MKFFKDIYLYYAVLVLIVVFVLYLRNPKRVIALLPVSIIGLVVLFFSEEYLYTLGLYHFPNAILPFYGIPLFHLLWGAGSAIIIMYFLPQDFLKKLLVILLFTAIVQLYEYIPEHIGKAGHLGKYTEIHDMIQDWLSLVIFVFLSEGLFGNRIHSSDKTS